MGEALAEAQLAAGRGERPVAAVAVVDEAMVARAHDRMEESNDPTAHAVIGALRETARRLGRTRLADATIFTTQEPCPMCVGALMEADIETLVYAVPNRWTARPARSSSWPSTRPCHDGSRSSVASARTRQPSSSPGSSAAEHPARPPQTFVTGRIGARSPLPLTARSRGFGILPRGEVSEWLMVPLSKSGVRKHRGFESRPLRHLACRRTGRTIPAGSAVSRERSPSGLWRRTGNAVRGNPSRVRIPPSPPFRRRRIGAGRSNAVAGIERPLQWGAGARCPPGRFRGILPEPC